MNGIDWTTIATQNAAGQSSSTLYYSFLDNSAVSSSKAFYRINTIDKDFRKNYSVIKPSNCLVKGRWNLWPNPTNDQVQISIEIEHAYKIQMQLSDNKGSVVRQWQKELNAGSNQLVLGLKALPPGVYHLVATWDEGREQQVIKILKQ